MKIRKEIRRFFTGCLLFLFVMMEAVSASAGGEATWGCMEKTGAMELAYAQQFSVDYYAGGYSLITIADSERYLTIPEGAEVPAELDTDITPLYLPLSHLYLAASSAMDLFREIGGLDCVAMTGTKAADWNLTDIAERVECGEILFSGKYNAPDYELLLSEGCDLAVESTMIFHTPDVKEQLEGLGIPVLIERSSYEPHPMGRVEWIRLYGLLTGHEKEAASFMNDAEMRFSAIEREGESQDGLSVAFFYLSSNGYVNVRKPGDYITRMIESAGGNYVFSDLVPESENALSTINLQMEAFYETAVDADILIYNSTVERELDTMEQLLQKSPLFADFKAVQAGRVWCTEKNMYQETTGVVGMAEDFYQILSTPDDDSLQLNYLHRLK